MGGVGQHPHQDNHTIARFGKSRNVTHVPSHAVSSCPVDMAVTHSSVTPGTLRDGGARQPRAAPTTVHNGLKWAERRPRRAVRARAASGYIRWPGGTFVRLPPITS